MLNVTQQDDDQKENKDKNEESDQIDSSSNPKSQIQNDENKKSGFTEFVRPPRDSNKPKYAPRIQPSTNFMEMPGDEKQESNLNLDYGETKFEPKNATDEPTEHNVDNIQKMFGLPVKGEVESEGNKKTIEDLRHELNLEDRSKPKPE